MSDAARRDRIDTIRDEIDDLARQVADGDLDAGTADRLRDRFVGELAVLESEVEIVDESAADDAATSHDAGGTRRIGSRALIGAALVGVAIVAIGVFAITSLDDRDTSGLEGVAGDLLDGSVDLSTITNEQMEAVVAENPDVVGMRLALARRYFESGEFDKALDHYFAVLEREQHPEALANIGWMTYLSGRPDIAAGYLEAALQRRSDYLPAQWFLANVYVTLGRGGEAAVLLVGLVESQDVPTEIRDGARELLDQIEAER
jgi:tetratricopeptide (TPR) repeat protein